MNKLLQKLKQKRNSHNIDIDFVDEWSGEGLKLRPVPTYTLIKHQEKLNGKNIDIDVMIDFVASSVLDKDSAVCFNDEEGKEYLGTLQAGDLFTLFSKSCELNTVKEEEEKSIKKK